MADFDLSKITGNEPPIEDGIEEKINVLLDDYDNLKAAFNDLKETWKKESEKILQYTEDLEKERDALIADKKAIQVLLKMNEDLIPVETLRAVIREVRKHL